MRKSGVIVGGFVLLILASLQAYGVDFYLETYGDDVEWVSSANIVDPGFPLYEYSYEITSAEAQVAFTDWYPVLDRLGEYASGSGSSASLPISVLYLEVDDLETGTYVVLSILIDSDGFGHASLTDFMGGAYMGYPITGLRISGTLTAQAVPEPTSLFGILAGLGLALTKRR